MTAKTDDTMLEVYDALGRRVTSKNLGSQSPGIYECTIFAEDLPSGVIFYRFSTERSSKMGMAILTR